MDDFPEAISAFLKEEKSLKHGFRWKSRRKDYARATAPVLRFSDGRILARVIITAHVSKLPPKYSFCLSFQNIPILRLDVEPNRSHTDFINLRRVRTIGTHWHLWPGNHAVSDNRALPHHFWLDEFLKRGRITSFHKYVKPPFRCENHGFNFDV